MSGRLSTVYWDTCVFIAHLTGEQKGASAISGMDEWIEKMERGQAIIATSALTLAEILESRLTDQKRKTYRALFQRKHLQLVACDEPIARLASEIRAYYSRTSGPDEKTISVADSIHLATAINNSEVISEFHTFDGSDPAKGEKKRARLLIPLSGNVAGYQLRICEPHAEQLRLVALR